LGTAHRVETLRLYGILDNHYETVVDLGGYDGAVTARVDATERIVVEPHLPDPAMRSAGVQFIETGGETSSLPDETADLLLLLDVLEHVDDPSPLISEALRLLKPGGRGVLTVPSNGIRIFPWFLQGWADRRWDHTIRRGFSPDELQRGISQHGGEVVKTLEMGNFGFRLLYVPLSALWRISQPLAGRLLRRVSSLDFRFRSLGSGHGYNLIEFRRAS
jgi:SAM-dependent methyltransferase